MPGRKWMKRVKGLSLLLIILLLLGGCWDRIEIDERAGVLGLAIDEVDPQEVEEGDPNVTHIIPPSEEEETMVRITAQIAVAGRLSLGPGGQEGQADGQESVWVIEAVGYTMDDAWQNMQQQISKRLFLGHLRVIVISEALAKKGVKNLNDFFRRHTDIRRAAWMMVGQGTASPYMESAPELERLPAFDLINTIDEAVRIGRFPEESLGMFWSKMSSLGQDAYLPYITLKEKENIEISGMAFFKREQMAGVIRPIEIAYFMAVREINPAGYPALIDLPEEKATLMFEADERKSNVEVEIQNGQPQVSIKIRIEGHVRQTTNPGFKLTPQMITKIEEQMRISKGEKSDYTVLFEKTQEHGADIFGFGEIVRAKHPQYWQREIQNKDKWQEMYKSIPIDVEVSYKIRETGMEAN